MANGAVNLLRRAFGLKLRVAHERASLGRRGLLAGVAGTVAAGLAKLGDADRAHATHGGGNILHVGESNPSAAQTAVLITPGAALLPAFVAVNGSGPPGIAMQDGIFGITHSALSEAVAVRGYVSSGPGSGVRGQGGTGGIGVWGESASRVGVFGTCTSGAGVFGVSSSSNPSGTAALPEHAGVSGRGFNRMGVQGVSDSQEGVRGTSTSYHGVAGISIQQYGVHGTSTNGYGVYGYSQNEIGIFGGSAHKPGIWGSSSSNTGVYGTSVSGVGVSGLSSSSVGVLGTSATIYGVNGVSTSGAGVFGVSNTGFGVYGYSYGTGGAAVGLYGVANSGEGLVGLTQTGIGVHGNAVQSGLAGRFDGKVVVNGTLTVTGGLTTSAIASADGDYRRTYSQESPEPWLEDFGQATLQGGRAEVGLDPALDAIVESTEYLVFLTPVGGETGALYVSRKGEHSFEVRSYAGPGASGAFDYRVVARRRDVQGARLENIPAANVNLGKDSPPPPAPRPVPDGRPATNGPTPRPDTNERPRP